MANPTDLTQRPTRCVLEGVPHVGFYEGGSRCPEDIPFASCLRACLEFMGDNLGCEHVQASEPWGLNCAYAYLLGTSGAAFQLSWKAGWHVDNTAITHMPGAPCTPFDRAFASVGYDHEVVVKEEGRDDTESFRKRIMESIADAGRPVLALGVVGPPECCVITGYDDGGEVVVGWSFFQSFPQFASDIEFEPSGYFRKRDWFRDTQALIVIGEKQEHPPLGDVYRSALTWALEVIHCPTTECDRHNGLAAYTAWADHLQQDAAFPDDDMALVGERYAVHDDAVGMVAERRWYGSLFLAQIARHEWTMASDLLAAASCYAAEHDLMWQIWESVGGIGRSDEQVRKLAEADVRRQIIAIIEQARAKEAEAADHIQRALGR